MYFFQDTLSFSLYNDPEHQMQFALITLRSSEVKYVYMYMEGTRPMWNSVMMLDAWRELPFRQAEPRSIGNAPGPLMDFNLNASLSRAVGTSLKAPVPILEIVFLAPVWSTIQLCDLPEAPLFTLLFCPVLSTTCTHCNHTTLPTSHLSSLLLLRSSAYGFLGFFRRSVLSESIPHYVTTN
jgi:hypothetical protein